jgi:hypothetical protein
LETGKNGLRKTETVIAMIEGDRGSQICVKPHLCERDIHLKAELGSFSKQKNPRQSTENRNQFKPPQKPTNGEPNEKGERLSAKDQIESIFHAQSSK